MKIRTLVVLLPCFLGPLATYVHVMGASPLAREAVAQKPLTALPYTPSLEPRYIDRTIDPCVDFYAYACGGWMRENPIPADQAWWTVSKKLAHENQQLLWGLLEDAARPLEGRSAAQQKIGDLFAACMDEAAIDERGAAPLMPDLKSLTKLKSKNQLARWLANFHLRLQHSASPMMFGFGSEQDPGNTTQVIAWAVVGGLGLPTRDHYIKDDARSIEIRRRYREHITAMFMRIGETAPQAASDVAAVLKIEDTLARATLTPTEQRDPHKVYHRMSIADLQALMPSFRWRDYLEESGSPNIDEINVTEPKFYAALEALLKTESLDTWRAYLRWHLLQVRAPYLSSEFVKADFAFYGSLLRGIPAMPPRWKTCVGWIDRDLGEALGQVFVEKVLPPTAKTKALAMVVEIEKAMAVRIQGLDWMSAETKKHALAKLAAVRNKIGHPDVWRDYSALQIRRGDLYGNVERASQFENVRQLAKIGRPVERGEWEKTPPTVTAYYHPLLNAINFPAGVLLPPRFDIRLDDAPNYGDLGAAIGHELVHAFDDAGRQRDAEGNLKGWWTAADATEFEKRTACTIEQYAQYLVVDDVHVNSRLTLGEDVADLGGLNLSYMGWKNATAGQTLLPRDGLTPEQRFFVGYGQRSCVNQRDEDKRIDAKTDHHSPARHRVNGVVANMPEFAEAFSCKDGAPMVREKLCRVW